MENQNVLESLDKALIAEGVSEEERRVRIDIVNDCIERGTIMSAKLKEMKARKSSPKAIFTTWATLEWGFFMLALGWFLGIFTLHDYQIQHP